MALSVSKTKLLNRGTLLSVHIYKTEETILLSIVKIGNLRLTSPVKIGYNGQMNHNIITFFLRLVFVACVWLLAWRLTQPRTQPGRVFRAAVLTIGLLAILAALKANGT